jgi:CDP-paratose 2-epimerase
MCNLYEKIINSDAIGAFNVGGGCEKSLSLLELFGTLRNIYDIDFEVVSRNQRISDQKVFISDNTKIINSTSWTPVVNINAGLEDAINWAKTI